MGFYNVIGNAQMQAGQPEDISVVLANFNAIAAVLNGNVDDSNIKAAANINASKLGGYPTDPTKALFGDGIWRWPASYGTTLPASPVDGQEAILVDSLTNPAYQWRFRYNAQSTSAYKWEFIGGNPCTMRPANFSGQPGTGQWLLQPVYTTKRSGLYTVTVGARMSPGTGGSSCYVTAYSDQDSAQGELAGGGSFAADWSGSALVPWLTALVGQSIGIAHWQGSANSQFVNQALAITPLKVA